MGPKRALLLVCCLLAGLGTLGCSGKPTLIGTWEAEGVGPNAIKGTLITFNADKTFRIESRLAGRDVTSAGDYSLDGNKLTHTVRSMSGLAEKYEKLANERLAKNPPTEVSTLEWRGHNEILMVSNTGKSILRKKS